MNSFLISNIEISKNNIHSLKACLKKYNEEIFIMKENQKDLMEMIERKFENDLIKSDSDLKNAKEILLSNTDQNLSLFSLQTLTKKVMSH